MINPDNFSMFSEGAAPEDLGNPGVGSIASGGGNPLLTAGLVGLKVLEAHKKRKEKERQEKFQAKVSQTNRTQNALMNMANIGRALKL